MYHTSGVYKDGRLRLHVSDDPSGGLAAFGDPDPLLASFRHVLRLSRDGLSLTSYFANSSSALDRPKAYLTEVIKGHSQALVDSRTDCLAIGNVWADYPPGKA
ncbi:MAG TPA: hypothetical protein VLC47_09410 [Burkholderiales bacterium]|nr:hypothetical protein [Burkholderiales bacterium]